MIVSKTIRQISSDAAFRRFLAGSYDGDVSKLVDDINASVNRLIQTDLIAAERLVDDLRRVFPYLPAEHQPGHIAMRARVQFRRGQAHEAIRNYLRARRQFEKLGLKDRANRIGQGLMEAYMYVGEHEKALEEGKRTLRRFNKQRDKTAAAKVMTNLGNVFHRLDNNVTALRYYDRARDIFVSVGGIPLAIVEFNRGNVFANLNQLDTARELYTSAAALYREAGASLAEAKAQYSIAYLEFLDDRLAESLRTFEHVHDRFLELGDVKTAAVTLLDLTEINLHLNQPGAAIMQGEELIPEFRELAMPYEQGKAEYFVGLARLQLGDLSDAARQLSRAAKIFEKENNPLWQGMVMLARGKTEISRRRFTKALELVKRARGLFRTSRDERRSLDAEIVQVEAELRCRKRSVGLARATRLLKKSLLQYQLYNLNDLLSRYYFGEKKYEDSLHHGKAAISAVEKMLTGLYPDEIRFFFLLDKYPTYLRVVSALAEQGNVDAAFIANSRALNLINYQRTDPRGQSTGIPPKLRAARDELRAAIKKMQSAPSTDTRTTGTSSAVALEHKLLAYERKIRARRYSAPLHREAEHVDPGALQAKLDEEEAVVQYYISGDKAAAFIVTATGVEHRTLPIDAKDLEVLLREFQFVMESAVATNIEQAHLPQAVDYYLKEMYRRILLPVLEGHKLSAVTVVADGAFGQIPWHALRSADGTFAMETLRIRMGVRVADLFNARDRSSRLSRLDNAVFTVASENLPAVEAEGTAIKRHFKKASLHSGDIATTGKLVEALANCTGFVHIATHAARSSENPLFSRILMTNGPLFPFDLLHGGINAELVTLSGCQTAAPGLYYGNSYSLAKAFYQAGSRFVLASLWQVSDQVSMQFMNSFYRYLRSTDDPDAAYRKTLSEMAARISNPALWAGFVLIGV